MRIRGFSLVELIAVIGIAAALAAVAIPRFASQQTFQERGFYDEALSAARYAQKYAVSSGCDVQFSVSGGTYQLNQRNRSAPPTCTNPPNDPFTVPVMHPGTGAASFTGTAPAGITFTMTGHVDPVIFNALGRIVDGATRTVTVGTRQFQIIGATGYVQAP